jgi:hypothetical protein
MKKKLVFFKVAGCMLWALLVFTGCSMEESETGGKRKGWLDPRLVGAWRFTFAGSYEQCVVTEKPQLDERNLGTLVFGSKGWGGEFNPGGNPNDYHDNFGGDIVYAEAFNIKYDDNMSAGIIIIEYWPGLENKWPWWSEAPEGWAEQGYRYLDKKFYGIYYINLYADGRKVFLACTNDQSTNYGPTETRTLEEAIAKFTKENLPNMINLDVGDPHTRYNGSLDGYEGPLP